MGSVLSTQDVQRIRIAVLTAAIGVAVAMGLVIELAKLQQPRWQIVALLGLVCCITQAAIGCLWHRARYPDPKAADAPLTQLDNTSRLWKVFITALPAASLMSIAYLVMSKPLGVAGILLAYVSAVQLMLRHRTKRLRKRPPTGGP